LCWGSYGNKVVVFTGSHCNFEDVVGTKTLWDRIAPMMHNFTNDFQGVCVVVWYQYLSRFVALRVLSFSEMWPEHGPEVRRSVFVNGRTDSDVFTVQTGYEYDITVYSDLFSHGCRSIGAPMPYSHE
jgi:hypothetical protein